MALIFRQPVVTPSPTRRLITADVFPNLLLATLAIVAGRPFNQTDWQAPIRARPASLAELAPNVTLRLGPQPPKIRAVEQPNPQPRKALQYVDPANLLTTTLAPKIAPVGTVDLAQVLTRKALGIEQPPNSLLAGIPSVPSAFLADWPNPQRTRFTTADQVANWLVRMPAVVPAPFVGADLPTPIARKYVGAIDAPPNTTLRGIPQPFPFASSDWPTPRRSVYAGVDLAPNLVLNALTVVRLPFRQSEQPLPPLRTKSAPYAEVGPNTTAAGIPSARLPFALNDWPQPMKVRALLHEVGGANILADSVPHHPFSQQDWPSVWRARPLTFDVTLNLQCSSLRGLLSGLPFTLHDWPTPGRAKPGDLGAVVTDALVFLRPPLTILRGGPRYIIGRAYRRLFTVYRDVRTFRITRRFIRTFTVSALTKLRFDEMEPGEAYKLTFDFTPDLPSGISIVSISSVAYLTVQGTDPDPSAIANGTPGIDSTSMKVIVPVKVEIDGCDYEITVSATTTDGLIVPVLVGVLPVRS